MEETRENVVRECLVNLLTRRLVAMKKTKKILIVVALIGSLILLFYNRNLAEAKDPEYPTKPINFYIPFGAGGTTDLSSRALIGCASKHLGQSFIPINRAGAGGTLAAMAVINSKPDGYTLGTISATNAFVPPFSEGAPYRDLSGLTMIMNYGSYVFPAMVRADAQWKSWKELVEWGKNNPGSITVANVGAKTVTINGLALDRVANREKIQLTFVSFKGSPEVLTAILGGHCIMYASTADPTNVSYLKEGKLRVLLFLSKEKIPGYEGIPSTQELYSFSSPGLLGVCGPQGLPEYILKKLGDAFAKAVKDPEFISVMNRMYTPIVYMDMKEMKVYVEKTFSETGEIIKLLKAQEEREKK